MVCLSFRRLLAIVVLTMSGWLFAEEGSARSQSLERHPVVVTEVARKLHADCLVFDGHNDLPWSIKNKAGSSFDPLTQYDAIASVASSPLVLVVANGVKANTVQELIAQSKAGPQKMNYASAGIGSVTHLVMEVFRDGAGMDAVHVPYKGGGQAVADVIAGHIPVTFASTQVAKNLVDSGRLKALAVTSLSRSPALPNVPTMKEAGVTHAEVDLRFWYGLFGPKGIPEAAKAKLDKSVSTVMSDPKVRERLAKLDVAPEYAPGAALSAKLSSEIRNWTAFIDAKGIKPE